MSYNRKKADEIVGFSGDDVDDGDVWYYISVPDTVRESTKYGIDWSDYSDYPFAMETVNGEIINLSREFQEEVLRKWLDNAGISEQELANQLSTGKCCGDWGIIFFSEVLGFNEDSMTFEFNAIGFLDSKSGWETKRFLESIGYKLWEDSDNDPHGHDSNGVYYCE